MKKFKGILAKPIVSTLPISQFPDAWKQRYALKEKNREREEALMRHYGYDPRNGSAWKYLALRLAEEVVPAYKLPKGKPRSYRIEEWGWVIFYIYYNGIQKLSKPETFKKIAEHVGVPSTTTSRRLNAYFKNFPDDFAMNLNAYLDSFAKSPRTPEQVERSAMYWVSAGRNAPIYWEQRIRLAEGRAPLYDESLDFLPWEEPDLPPWEEPDLPPREEPDFLPREEPDFLRWEDPDLPPREEPDFLPWEEPDLPPWEEIDGEQ